MLVYIVQGFDYLNNIILYCYCLRYEHPRNSDFGTRGGEYHRNDLGTYYIIIGGDITTRVVLYNTLYYTDTGIANIWSPIYGPSRIDLSELQDFCIPTRTCNVP